MLEQIELFLRLGALHTKVIFYVVEPFPVNILIGTDFSDEHVTGIYPAERKLRPENLKPKAILSTVASKKLEIATASDPEVESHRASIYNSRIVMKNTVR